MFLGTGCRLSLSHDVFGITLIILLLYGTGNDTLSLYVSNILRHFRFTCSKLSSVYLRSQNAICEVIIYL